MKKNDWKIKCLKHELIDCKGRCTFVVTHKHCDRCKEVVVLKKDDIVGDNFDTE